MKSAGCSIRRRPSSPTTSAENTGVCARRLTHSTAEFERPSGRDPLTGFIALGMIAAPRVFARHRSSSAFFRKSSSTSTSKPRCPYTASSNASPVWMAILRVAVCLRARRVKPPESRTRRSLGGTTGSGACGTLATQERFQIRPTRLTTSSRSRQNFSRRRPDSAYATSKFAWGAARLFAAGRSPHA